MNSRAIMCRPYGAFIRPVGIGAIYCRDVKIDDLLITAGKKEFEMISHLTQLKKI